MAPDYLSDLIFPCHATIWLFKEPSKLVLHLRTFAQSGPSTRRTLLPDSPKSASTYLII